ncbi:MAG: hypothetical protein NPIRA04_35610 [Nitrospirales bacterium]|nr:MAG: hypothetical protein NPIRA04_35610 [Nitrospirales bacterium]
MYHEDKTFTVSFSLEAHFSDDYEGDEDEQAWLHDWESRVMPDVVKSIFTTLRKYPSWSARVRNRGIAPTEAIEIALIKDYTKPVNH